MNGPAPVIDHRDLLSSAEGLGELLALPRVRYAEVATRYEVE